MYGKSMKILFRAIHGKEAAHVHLVGHVQGHALLEEGEGGVGVSVLRRDVDERASVLRASRNVRFVFVDQNLHDVRVTALRRDVQSRAIQLHGRRPTHTTS